MKKIRRRAFGIGLGCAAGVFGLDGFSSYKGREVVIECIDGPRTVTFGSASWFPTASAQDWLQQQNVAAYYQQLQWLTYQRALAAQQQYLAQMAQQYQWLQQHSVDQFRSLAGQYADGYRHSQAMVMDKVESIYGIAKKSGLGDLVMYGLSRLGLGVYTKYAVPAFAGLWQGLRAYQSWTDDSLQENLAPQSTEEDGGLEYDGEVHEATAYETAGGAVALTKYPIVKANGRPRRLAKLSMNSGDGHLLIV